MICVHIHKHKRTPTKTIGIRDDVYERLKAHKRGDESFSETVDRILSDVDTDWRTNVGFLADEEADELGEEVERGTGELDATLNELGDHIDEEFQESRAPSDAESEGES